MKFSILVMTLTLAALSAPSIGFAQAPAEPEKVRKAEEKSGDEKPKGKAKTRAKKENAEDTITNTKTEKPTFDKKDEPVVLGPTGSGYASGRSGLRLRARRRRRGASPRCARSRARDLRSSLV